MKNIHKTICSFSFLLFLAAVTATDSASAQTSQFFAVESKGPVDGEVIQPDATLRKTASCPTGSSVVSGICQGWIGGHPDFSVTRSSDAEGRSFSCTWRNKGTGYFQVHYKAKAVCTTLIAQPKLF